MGQKYGQHFLHDESVLDQIEHTIDGFKSSLVVEIGPGKGALTRRLLRKPYELLLSEIDTNLQSLLEKLVQGTDTQIVWGDVLQQKIHEEPKGYFGSTTFPTASTIVVGNLPYYITSPILRRFFFDITALPGGVFLVQKEVANKIKVDAPKKSYLWRLLNLAYEVNYIRTVKAESFTPPPHVLSAVIVLHKLASPRLESNQIPRLLAFLDLASPFKRKTLGKIRKMQQEKFEKLNLSISDFLYPKRLEELGREEMREILL